jgi:hypothetical protein
MPASTYFELLPEDFSEQSTWKTDVSTFDSGTEQRRSRWSSDRTTYSFGYPNAYDDQITTIWDYYRARKGGYESFYLAVPPALTYSESVAEATYVVLSSATKPSPANLTVRVDNSLLSGWTYTEAEKRINFDSEITGDVKVEYYELKLVRFLSDVASRDWMAYVVTNQSLDFITV